MATLLPISNYRGLKGQGIAFLILLASWFHPHEGDRAMVAASRDYPKGTVLILSHQGRRVLVRVTDWGPSARFVPDRGLDLSPAAFEKLAPLDQGLIDVEVHVLSRPQGTASKASIP